MEVIYDQIVGEPFLVESSLRRSIGALSRHGAFHQKVGITNNPERRWTTGYKNNGWLEMRVLYESGYWQDVCAVEKIIYRWFAKSRTFGWYYNERDGGAGRVPEVGPFYVYVVGARRYARITL